MSILMKSDQENKATEVDLIYWFLHKKSASQKKLQKLAYYAQAWSLVLLNEDIVDGIEFQAWVHGPVNFEIRKELVEFGWNNLSIPAGTITPEETFSKFSEAQNDVLEQVWKVYGELTADQLEALTHQEEPWLEKRQGLEKFEASREVISNETMKKYYSKFIIE